MNQRTITCPYCASQVSGDSTICPGCQEDLAALAHLEYADAIHYNQALSFAKEGRLREARAELEESLLANHAFGPSLALLAKVYAREGDWEKARVAVKKALSAMPSDEAIVKLADDIITAAPAVEPLRSSLSSQPVEVPSQPVASPEIIEETEPEVTEAEPPAAEPPDLPILEQEAPPISVSSKSKLITEHASAEDVASLSKPLPWQSQPEIPATRVVHVSRFDPIVPVEPEEPPAQPEPEELPVPEPVQVPSYESQPQPAKPAGLLTGIPLPQGSLWRTIGKGVLITFGLAILIRALSGDD